MWLEEKEATERRAAVTDARSDQAAASLAGVAALDQAGIDDFSAAGLNAVEAGGIADGDCRSGVGSDRNDGHVATAATAAGVATGPQPARPARHLFSGLPRILRSRRLPGRRPVRPMAWRISRPTFRAEARRLRRPAGRAGVVWILATVRTGAAHGTDGLDPIGAALLLCRPDCPAGRVPGSQSLATARRNELGRGRHLAGARRPGPHRLGVGRKSTTCVGGWVTIGPIEQRP